MIRMLTVEEVLELVQNTPEQAVYDWKSDFKVPDTPETRGEIIKDITAIGNALTSSYGFIIYGVDPRRPDPVIGITNNYDDSRLQQLLKDKVRPAVDFVYYEVSTGVKIIGVIQVRPNRKRPHIIATDIGKIRSGQIPIRRGSSTEGVTLEDLFEMFYGPQSAYFASVKAQLDVGVREQQADLDYLHYLERMERQTVRDMEIAAGLNPGELGF